MEGLNPVPQVSNALPAFFAVLTWAALALQLFVYVPSWPPTIAGLVGAVTRFFIFFTILTNLLVALFFTALASQAPGLLSRIFLRPTLAGAVCVYIVMVGVVFNLLLRGQAAGGMQFPLDIFLHDITPIACVYFWFTRIRHGLLRWKHALAWIGYPLCFAVYNHIYSFWVAPNPYPFLDTIAYGHARVAINVSVLTLVFLGMGLLLIGIDRHIAQEAAAS